MLIAFPVLPLLASTMVSPGPSSPSRSARSIMYLAIRALMDPDGSRIGPPPRRAKPTAGCRATPAELVAGSRPSAAADRVPLVAFMPAPYACAAAVPPCLRAGQWFRGKWTAAWGRLLRQAPDP